MTRYKGHETQGDGYNTTEPSPCVLSVILYLRSVTLVCLKTICF